MSISSHALRGARVVRAATVGAVLALLVGLVALRAFEADYGRQVTRVVTRAETESTQLRRAIEQQTALGRSCGRTPVVTDVVLYEALGADDVTVVTFDQALARTTAGAGWIRGYCV
jgi:hypothetical protein